LKPLEAEVLDKYEQTFTLCSIRKKLTSSPHGRRKP
jgi:hypothetical protein